MFVETMPDDVTWFSSSQQGAPQMMGGSNGDMLKVLDACAVDGFGESTATSVTKDLDETTISFGVGHGYLSRQKVLITGAEDPLLNGVHKIRSLTATTITIYTPAVTSIAGTIIVKVSPLGWESIFGKTDPLKRAYRSLSPTSAKRVLYLNMDYPSEPTGYHSTSPAKRASVSVCQDMQILGEQIGSITNETNNFQANPNGSLFWYQKRGASNTDSVPNTPTSWKIVGNSEFFYFIIGWRSDIKFDSLNYCDVFAFGEYVGLNDDPSDKTFLMAVKKNNDSGVQNIGTLGAYIWSGGSLFSSTGVYVLIDSVLKYVSLSVVGGESTISLVSGVGKLDYPNAKGSALFTLPLRIARSDSNVVYGFMPSLLFVENNIQSLNYDSSIVDDILLTQVQDMPGSNPYLAYYAFYIGG